VGRPGAKLIGLIVLFAGLLGVGFWGLEASSNGDTSTSEAQISPPSAELSPRTVNSPRIVHPGWEYGNCTVPGGGAVEVFPEEAVAHGGRVFDKGISRYYSLPNGRCMVLRSPYAPPPDWVPEWMEKQPPPPSRPTIIFAGASPCLKSDATETPPPPTTSLAGTDRPQADIRAGP